MKTREIKHFTFSPAPPPGRGGKVSKLGVGDPCQEVGPPLTTEESSLRMVWPL